MVDALQLLLDDLGRRLVERRGVGAGEDCGDADLRRGQRRELRDRQRADRSSPNSITRIASTQAKIGRSMK